MVVAVEYRVVVAVAVSYPVEAVAAIRAAAVEYRHRWRVPAWNKPH